VQILSDISAADRVVLQQGMPHLKQAIAHLCQTDFLVFQRVELGFDIGGHHRKWAARLSTGMDTCEMAPRDHGKSSSMARAYPIWKVKYDKWVKEVLILGPDQPTAVENLDKIKMLLDSRPSLQYLVPKRRRDTFYSRTEILLTNGKSIKAKGKGSPLRGRHPQLIICDDMLNESNSLTTEHQAETRRHLNEVIVPMKDKGQAWMKAKGYRPQLVVVGTAQDRGDLYHELQNNEEYIGEKLVAIIDDEKEQVLWPERYTYDDLMAVKRKVGAIAFSKEYQNNPLSEETTIFPPSLFEPLKDKNLSYVNTYEGPHAAYMGVDFSVPGSLDGDYTVIYVLIWDTDSKEFIPLNFWRARPGALNEQVNEIELWCQKFNITLGYLEDNLFQGVYTNLFATKSALPLTGHTVTHSKKGSLEYGILGFRPQFENGAWRFPYKTNLDRQKTDIMIEEFNGVRQRRGKIGNESFHDDIVMAMWHATSAARAETSFSVSWE